MMGDRDPDESTRLFDSHQDLSEPENSLSSLRRQPHGVDAPGASVWRTILTVAAVQVLLNVGSFVSLAAQLAILEDIVCEEYYRNRPSYGADNRCKVDAVQTEVAFINGWKDVFEILPGTVRASVYNSLELC